MANENIIIYNTEDGKAKVSLYARDGNVWMNQNQIAELFATSKQNIGQHVANKLEAKELDELSVVEDYFRPATVWKKSDITFYSLEMILAIGFRVRSRRGTQFRIWANSNLREYMLKGFIIDDERLKNPDGRPDYFDELLERIRDIRASEKRFYQKLRDLFALSSDYDKTDKATQMFFAEIQNKLHYAVTGKTRNEIIAERAAADKPNMGLTSWKGSVVRLQDITIAKNYLTKDEIDSLNRLVSLFLDSAEMRVKERKDFTMDFWRKSADRIIEFQDLQLLKGYGKISTPEMEQNVRSIYSDFDQLRKRYDAIKADKNDE